MSVRTSRLADVSRRTLLSSIPVAAIFAFVPKIFAQQSSATETQEPLSPTDRKKATEKLTAYFKQTAPKMLRPSQEKLAHPSISPSLPGKEYSTQLWDWDTLWTSRGLFQLAKRTEDQTFHAQVAEHARGSLLNFLEHQSAEGRLPICMMAHNVDPFGSLGKAAPNHQNQAKPIMAQLALLVADETGSVDWLSSVFDRILRFHDSWVLGNQTSIGLLVWGDDVAIGNDNDPTTFGRPFFSSANLLLNCLFYMDLRAAQTLALRLGRTEQEEQIRKSIHNLGAAIQEHCWDSRDSFFYTADVQCVDRRAELIRGLPTGMSMSWSSIPLRIQVFTGFLPLWCGLATPKQATQLLTRNYLTDARFHCAAGVRSLSNLESMYSLEFSGNPSNWLGPVWVIVNYLIWKSLKDYGFNEAARDLANKTIYLLSSSLDKDSSLNEYYHPDTGAPLSRKGFMDWDLLVLEML